MKRSCHAAVYVLVKSYTSEVSCTTARDRVWQSHQRGMCVDVYVHYACIIEFRSNRFGHVRMAPMQVQLRACKETASEPLAAPQWSLVFASAGQCLIL